MVLFYNNSLFLILIKHRHNLKPRHLFLLYLLLLNATLVSTLQLHVLYNEAVHPVIREDCHFTHIGKPVPSQEFDRSCICVLGGPILVLLARFSDWILELS